MNEEHMEILKLDLHDAWNWFITLCDDKGCDEYRQARFGVNTNIPFDIYDYFNGTVLIKSKRGKVYIRKHECSLTDFYTELEDREKIIKTWILDNTEEEDIYSTGGNSNGVN